MHIFLLTRNPTLIQDVDIILHHQSPDHDLRAVSSLNDVERQPGGAEAGALLLDAELPAWQCAALSARLGRDLRGMRVTVIMPPAQSQQVLPGFKAHRHVTMPLDGTALQTAVAPAPVGSAGSAQKMRVGDLMVDGAARAAFLRDTPVPLTRKEFEVLEVLASRPGEILSKDVFLSRLYGGGPDGPEGKIIDVFICKIRAKLRKLTGGDGLIDTVWGRGYVLRDPGAGYLEDLQPRSVAG